MEPNKAFKEYKDAQERIKQMCIENVKTYFKPSEVKALLKHIEENNFALYQALFAAEKLASLKVIHLPDIDPAYFTVVCLGRRKVLYDRWGFCSIGTGPKIDQASLKTTLQYLLRRK